jgi:putative tryptophan/tyrosine transport system substrate-binding protein
MKRREFVAGVGGAAAWPLAVRAQGAERVRRVGFLYPFRGDPRYYAQRVTALRERLAELGWIEGRNLRIEIYYGPQEQIDDRAAELVRSAPDVIVTGPGINPARAVQQLTRTIPIVFVRVGDPVVLLNGFGKSIARPEGNATGFTNRFGASDISAKWVQFLKEAAPQISRIAIVADISLLDAPDPVIETAAKEMGIELVRIAVRTRDEVTTALRVFAAQPNGGVIVRPPMGPLMAPVISLAAEYKLPSIGASFVDTDAGTLLSYGENDFPMFSDAATYVDRILRGAKVGDLPVQFAGKVELIINRKTAKTIGLEVPPNLLALADRVIE